VPPALVLKVLLCFLDVLANVFRNRKRFLPYTAFNCYSLQCRHTVGILALGTELLKIVS